MSVHVLPWAQACEMYGSEWGSLVDDVGLNPSLHPDWMGVALRSQGMIHETCVVVVRDEGRAEAFVPVTLRSGIRHGIPVTLADLASNAVSYHAQLIARRPSAQLLDLVFEVALRGRWDVLRAYNVHDEGSTAMALREWASSRRYRATSLTGECSPYLPISCDWETFLRSRPKKFRANVARVLRKPAEYGHMEMRWFMPGDDIDPLLEHMLLIEKRSWKVKSGVAICDRPGELDYHRHLLPMLSRSGSLLANVLYIDGSPVAYVLCCMSGGWVGQLKTSFCDQVKDAGACVVTASVMQAFEAGAKEYDFLGDADPHKRKWTDEVRQHCSYTVFGGRLRGRLTGFIDGLAMSLRSIGRRRQGTGILSGAPQLSCNGGVPCPPAPVPEQL